MGTQNKAVKFKPVSANKSAQFLKSVRANDIFAAKNCQIFSLGLTSAGDNFLLIIKSLNVLR